MIIAINQIGIAATLVNILFVGIVAALSLAFGLAFGLGGRDVAAELTRQWYDSSRERMTRASEKVGGSERVADRPALAGAQGSRARPK